MIRLDTAGTIKKAVSSAVKRFGQIIGLRGAAVPPELQAKVRAEKAVIAAVKHFYRMVDPCGTAESLGLKSGIMAQKLVMDNIVGPTNKTRADQIIFQVFSDRKKSAGSDLPLDSMESQVAQALLGAGIVLN